MKKEIEKILKERGIKVNKIKNLAGDASERKFFRIYTDTQTLVLMQYPAPINLNLKLLKVYKFYRTLGLPVPVIKDVLYKEGIIILDDLGDLSLQRYVKKVNQEKIKGIYLQAVDLIQKIQKGTEKLDSSFFSNHYILNKERLLWELRFFLKNFVQKFLKKEIKGKDSQRYNSFFKTLIDLIDLKKMVLCHRDFHSRNIFIKNKIFIVDYQDSTLGPPLYDLSSLLFDSYLHLCKKLREELIEYAFNLNNYKWTRKKFLTQLIVTSLQRNIKALGTFGYQITSRNRKRYLAYIPRTLKYLMENILIISEIKEFKDLINSWKK